MNNNLLQGVFIGECPNRFIGKVKIKEEIVECYIPSSSRLENFIILENKLVLLTPNKGENKRTSYSLFAVKYLEKYILLNLNMVNEFMEPIMLEEFKTIADISGGIHREKKVGGYKADLLFKHEKGVIIENKSIISLENEVCFPKVFPQRAIDQLEKLHELILNGYKVFYNFVSLSPFIKKVKVSILFDEYYNAFRRCVDEGMQVRGYSITYSNEKIDAGKIEVEW